ncbi:MAG: hypothetical protein ACI4OU_02125 [Candidatus Enterenecus sp.]
MDIKKAVEDIVNKLKKDDDLKEQFLKNPVAALEKITGIDLPDDQIDGVIAAVKAKLGADSVGDALKGLGGLFKK